MCHSPLACVQTAFLQLYLQFYYIYVVVTPKLSLWTAFTNHSSYPDFIMLIGFLVCFPFKFSDWFHWAD